MEKEELNRFQTYIFNGEMLFQQGKYDSSILVLEKAKRIAEPWGDSPYLIAALTKMGNIFAYNNEKNKAIEYYQKSFKIALNIKDGRWHGDIQPTDSEKWFDSYREFVLYYARVAREQGVELFCLGTELSSLDKSCRTTWEALIDSIRMIHPQVRLTYTADWGSFASVTFLD